MVGKWPVQRLPDLLTLQRGHDLAADKRVDGEFPVIAATGQVGVHNEAKCDAPGVVIGRSGSIGGAQWIDEPFWPLNTTLYVIDFKGNNPYFCYSVLKSIDFQRFNAGSGVPTLNRNHLADIEVPAISRTKQDGIANLLYTLDAKIDLNRQMAATLEEMARALFKSWFVDFDPIHAKAEGRDTGLPAEIAALFSDSFDDDGLPKGWMQSTVGELFSIVAGNTPSTKRAEYWDGPHAWATPKDMSGLPGPLLTKTDRSLTEQGFDVCSSGEIPEMSLLMSSRAPVGYLAFNALRVSINQGIAAFVSKTLSPFYAWAWCHENMKLIKSNANGSTFQEISKGVLRTIAMAKPSQAVHDAFVVIVETTFSRIVQLAEETASLTSLRDELLPKLLSGELHVADAETVIAAA